MQNRNNLWHIHKVRKWEKCETQFKSDALQTTTTFLHCLFIHFRPRNLNFSGSSPSTLSWNVELLKTYCSWKRKQCKNHLKVLWTNAELINQLGLQKYIIWDSSHLCITFPHICFYSEVRLHHSALLKWHISRRYIHTYKRPVPQKELWTPL